MRNGPFKRGMMPGHCGGHHESRVLCQAGLCIHARDILDVGRTSSFESAAIMTSLPSTTSAASAPPFLPLSSAGASRYTLAKQIGGGSFGRVFRATDGQSGRAVAGEKPAKRG